VVIQTVTAPLTRLASIIASQKLHSVTVQKAARVKLCTPQRLADKKKKKEKKKRKKKENEPGGWPD